MWDWTAWQGTGQVVWDWGSKMGLGGLALWLFQRWLGKRDKLADRGQRLMDEARPELVPIGGTGTQYALSFNVRNEGKGTAYLQRLELTGVQPIDCQGQVPMGKMAGTVQLHVQGAPLFDPASAGHAQITLCYADKFENEYWLSVPASVDTQTRP